MTNTELLKAARDALLSLHKFLVDYERGVYEAAHGKVTPAEYLNLLLEDPGFSWLRRFSTLIVDIDEMFAQKDGFPSEAVDIHLSKLRGIVRMEDADPEFIARYQAALQHDLDAAAKQGELRDLLS